MNEGGQVAEQDDDTTTTVTEDTDTGAGETSGGPDPTPPEPARQQPTPPAPAPVPSPVPVPRPAAPVDEWKPPSRDEWEKVTAGLRDAAGESKKRKEELRTLRAQLEEMELKTATAEERAAKELEIRLAKEADDRWRPRVVSAAARSALVEAGCKDAKRFARLLDMGRLEVGDDGEVTGLDEQVGDLKKDYPEAFKRERPAASDPPAAQPGSTRAPSKKLTPTERQAAALLGKF